MKTEIMKKLLSKKWATVDNDYMVKKLTNLNLSDAQLTSIINCMDVAYYQGLENGAIGISNIFSPKKD